ncbi:MAG: chromate transporter [Flavobacterium sp.]|jgi:chromate transporter|nr:MAG: chromate transporter [Flavobacterium sp.]
MIDQNKTQPIYTLLDLVKYFLKIGTIGFGGPVALIGYMQNDLVEDRKWISESDFKEGLALSQLAPGPLAAQLGIYIGFVHFGILGATLTGIAFVLPSFIMVVLLGVAYKTFGGLPWMQAVFYGISAAVIGIITLSSYKLTTKSIGDLKIASIKSNWLLWTFYIITTILTIVTEKEEMLLFLSLGFIYMLFKAPPEWIKQPNAASFLALSTFSFSAIELDKLGEIAWFFTKAGAFVFGSGLAIVPFLHTGVVNDYRWLTENQFVDAVAVAMITPGPVVITVGFIGYLVAGFKGACIAALATFLPCYLFTILPAPYFKKIANNKSIKAFVDGITAAVIGALMGAVVVIALRTIIDIPTAIIAIGTIFLLLYVKKLKEPHIIALAALLGIISKILF